MNFDTYGTKYHPLFEHLLYAGHGQTTMTFAEIEAVIEAKLAPSARTREEWWSNSPNGHSQARAWMRAGYRTSQVDLAGGRVTFTREGWPEGFGSVNLFDRPLPVSLGLGEAPQAEFGAGVVSNSKGGTPAGLDHPLFGIWKDKVTLIPGYDYTKPAFDPDDPIDG